MICNLVNVYPDCRINNVKFYRTEYINKYLYTMRVCASIGNEIIKLVYRYGDKFELIKRIAYEYRNGAMQKMDIGRCVVNLGQEYFIRDSQTGNICKDESGKYPLWAQVYRDENNLYNYVNGNAPSLQIEYLIKKNILILSADNELLIGNLFIESYNTRELSLEELLK